MRYGTILADPPWPYHSPNAVVGNGGRGHQDGRAGDIIQANVEQHYRTMSVEDIGGLDIESCAGENAHLYLWTTNSFVVEAHGIARSWGFEPKTLLTWVKVHHADHCRPSMKTGYWYRSATEHVVFAVRGRLRLAGPAAPTAYLSPRLPHSIKPDSFYDLIETQSPGPYLELFARKTRNGWDSLGDAIDGKEIKVGLKNPKAGECATFPGVKSGENPAVDGRIVANPT